jgi:hypothetical protein
VYRGGINSPVVAPLPVTHPGHGNGVVVPYPVFVGGGYYNYGAPSAVFVQPPLFMENFSRPSETQQQAAAQQALFLDNFSAPSRSAPAQDAPVVIVNQYFTPDAAPTPAPAPSTVSPAPVQQSAPMVYNQAPEPVIYLIAMKDHTIYAANAYYVENGVLNYTTLQGSQNSASLELVDRELSDRLNRERKVAFGLPGN